jgi:hypothetical protein
MRASRTADFRCVQSQLRFQLLCLTLAGISLVTAFDDRLVNAANHQAALKAERSQFDMREVKDFISHTLMLSQPEGSLHVWGMQTRTVSGRLVDHAGQPIEGAYVAFVEPQGFSHNCYNENFDRTDEEGRFLVEGDLLRSRIVVRRGRTQHLAVNVADNADSVDVVWPEPATVRLTVDPEFLGPEDRAVCVRPTRQTGLSSLFVPLELDEKNSIEITDQLPGEFAVCTLRSIRAGKRSVSRYVEVGTFEVAAGEKLSMDYHTVGKRRVSGKCPAALKGPAILTVDRIPASPEDAYRCFDHVLCEDGTFETAPLPPGRYVLRFREPPQPKAPGIRLPVTRSLRPVPTVKEWRHRIVVPTADEPLNVVLSSSATDARSRIESILDAQRDIHVSAFRDFGIMRLGMTFTEDEVRQELLRLFKAPDTPQEWKYSIRKLFGQNLDDDEVYAAMLDQLANAERLSDRIAVLSEFRNSQTRIRAIVDAIAPYRNAQEVRLRWSALKALGRLIDRDESLRETILPWLIEATSDRYEGIRFDMVATLGRIGAEESVPALNTAIKDPVGKVRVMAAWALWRITGERERPIKLMTIRLRADDHSGKVLAARYLGEFDQLPEITVKQLRRHTLVDVKPPYRGENLLRFQLKNAALSSLKKVRPSDFESAVSPSPNAESQKFD